MINSDKRRRLAFALYDAGRLMRKTIDQRVRGLGLSHAQWSILAALARNEGQRQVDLAGEMDLEPITVARLIDRLEAAELVERRRDASDRRARRLYLKPAAETTLAALKKTGDEIMLSAFAGLDEHEMDVATAVLERLRASFQATSQSSHGTEAPRTDDAARPAAPDRLGRLQHVG